MDKFWNINNNNIISIICPRFYLSRHIKHVNVTYNVHLLARLAGLRTHSHTQTKHTAKDHIYKLYPDNRFFFFSRISRYIALIIRRDALLLWIMDPTLYIHHYTITPLHHYTLQSFINRHFFSLYIILIIIP